MHTPLNRILYVENNKELARLLQKRMEQKNLTLDIAFNAEDAIKCLECKPYDLLLVEYHLPGMNGLDLLDTLKALPAAPPIIILTASGDERIAVAALERGAADYAIKDSEQTYIELLPAVMQAAYTKERLLRIMEQQHQELLEAKQKAKMANQAKSTFLATMSHEMRTPLNVVIGVAHLLSEANLNDKERNMLAMLLCNANLLIKLINDLLDLSRIESGQMELETQAFDISSLLADIRIMFEATAAAKGLELVFMDETHGYAVIGDRTRVQQILMNLVGNALKFTEKGKVQVQANIAESGKSGFMAVTFEVRDTGIGIPQEKLSSIFNKFIQADETITRRFGGSGLGLSIAQSLSQCMGGEIKVQSAPGEGSVFTVMLLLPSATAQSGKRPKELLKENVVVLAECRGTVLVVEDYSPNIMVARMMLNNMGFNVLTAETGEKALEYLKAANTPYTAILMDVQMHEMDGLETTRRIREIEKSKGFHNIIIGVTAHALAGDREHCLAAGMDDYVSKPIHPNILEAKLKSCLEAFAKAA